MTISQYNRLVQKQHKTTVVSAKIDFVFLNKLLHHTDVPQHILNSSLIERCCGDTKHKL